MSDEALREIRRLNEAVEFAIAEGRVEEALEKASRARRLGRDGTLVKSLDFATTLHHLGTLYDDQGDFAAARPLLEEALEIDRRALRTNPKDTDVANTTATRLNHLGALFYAREDYAAARPLFEEALEICRRRLGNDGTLTAVSLNNVGMLYAELMGTNRVLLADQRECVAQLLEEALNIRRRHLGNDHPLTLQSLRNLGGFFSDLEDYDAARLPLAGRGESPFRALQYAHCH